jgi:hypothetical protein
MIGSPQSWWISSWDVSICGRTSGKTEIRFPGPKMISKVYFASEYLRENYGGMKDYSTKEPDPKPRLESIFNVGKRDDIPIVFDTGASMSLTPLREDFEGEVGVPPITTMHGLQGAVKVVGVGKVSWTVFDAYGVVRVIKTTAYLVPEGNIRLFTGLLSRKWKWKWENNQGWSGVSVKRRNKDVFPIE